MCRWGDVVHMHLKIPAHLSHTGKEYMKPVGIDRCIAPIIKALNDAGITTDASCCGHEKIPGSIILSDNRWLIVCDEKTAKAFFDLMPITIHGELKSKHAEPSDQQAG